MVNIELDRVQTPAEDSILLKSSQTRAFVGQEEIGSGRGGDLFVAKDCVSWIDSDGEGFALVYQTIALHGTCRDLTAFPHPCIYLMIDGKLPNLVSQADSDDEESDAEFTEIRFVPSTDSGVSLEDLYAAFSRGQSLNPDPNIDDSEDSEAGAEYDCTEEGNEFFEDTNGNGHPQFEDHDDDHMAQ